MFYGDETVWQWTVMILTILLVIITVICVYGLSRLIKPSGPLSKMFLKILAPLIAILTTALVSKFIEEQINITGDVLAFMKQLETIVNFLMISWIVWITAERNVVMTTINEISETEPRLKSPSAGALAGIVFAILTMMQLFLFRQVKIGNPAEVTLAMLDEWASIVSLALGSISFAGIAFLWFTGVIRDWLGDQEDRFFATIFFGSGIIFVVLMFIYSAAWASVFATYALSDVFELDQDVLVYGYAFVDEILSNYILRVAGVYMSSIGSLLGKIKRGPRWLTTLTYILAIGFILFAGQIRESRFLFPLWVLLVSLYILNLNFRNQTEVQS